MIIVAFSLKRTESVDRRAAYALIGRIIPASDCRKKTLGQLEVLRSPREGPR